jgi:hypothetical protein
MSLAYINQHGIISHFSGLHKLSYRLNHLNQIIFLVDADQLTRANKQNQDTQFIFQNTFDRDFPFAYLNLVRTNINSLSNTIISNTQI